MKRLLKWSAAVVALLLVALAALPFLIDANRFRPLLEQQLSQSLGRKVTIGDLSLAVLSGGVAASDLSIAEDPAFGSRPFLSAKSVKIGVDLRALIFSRQLKVQDVTVNGADVALQQNPEGAWNFSSLGATKSTAAAAPVPPPVSPEAPLSLTVGLVRIQDARITLSATDGSTEARGFKDVNFELRNFSTSTAMPFSLQAASTGGGTLKLTGNAGPLASAKTEQTPFDAQIDISKLDLAKSGFTSPASGLAGLLTFKGSANSNGATAAIKGALILDDLRLSKTGKPAPRPVALNIALVHDLNKRRGEVARSIVKLGSASATLTGSYNLAADPPSIDAKLSGPNMPLTELAAFLPMFDIVLPAGATISSGTASLDVTSKGSFVRLNTVGSVKLEKAQLANYDLGSKLRIIGQLAGVAATPTTDIQLVAANFEAGPSGTTVREIQFNAPALGQITGEGSVSPEHALDFRMRATVRTGGLLAAAMQQKGETSTVPFLIQGTSANPSFKPDLKSLGNEKLQQVIGNPEGALKTAKGILDMFKKAPKQPTQ